MWLTPIFQFTIDQITPLVKRLLGIAFAFTGRCCNLLRRSLACRSRREAVIVILDEARLDPDFHKARFVDFAPVVFDESPPIKLTELA